MRSTPIRRGTATLRRATVAAAALALVAGGSAATATAAHAGSGAASVEALNDPVTVTLTVTGPDAVVYDDEVTTTGHAVSPATEVSHLCDGTNLGANADPGATPTSALDDSGLTWDGVWYDSFEDYLVTDIDGISQTADEFWLITVNGVATPVGGCQFLVDEGDEVGFTWTEID